tara:strand:+ start:392 stop:640 length:249 start_codon:yes stop_codon:yes gene_type:complete
MKLTLVLDPNSVFRLLIAISDFFGFRFSITTSASLLKSILAASYPAPVFAPVIKYVLPFKLPSLLGVQPSFPNIFSFIGLDV